MQPIQSLAPATPIAGTALTVELFDPPRCCPTGLCGPTLDQTLLDVNELVLALQARGVRVARYQMANAPEVFLRYPDVLRLIRTQQMAALPITVVAGQIIKAGAYPTLLEIEQALSEARL